MTDSQNFLAVLRKSKLNKMKKSEAEDGNLEFQTDGEDEDYDDEVEDQSIDQYFNNFKQLTMHTWNYDLPNGDQVKLDDTELVIINQ